MKAGCGFHFLYHDGNSNVGRYFNLQMNMVLINVDSDDMQRGIFFQKLPQFFEQLKSNIVLEVFVAVFCTPNYVILMLVGGMI